MKDGFGEITEEITDERKDYISYKMEIIFLRCDRICSDVCISVKCYNKVVTEVANKI